MGLACSIALYRAIHARELQAIEHAEREHADRDLAAIEYSFLARERILTSVVALFNASEEVTLEEFKAFTVPLLADDLSLQALGWDLVVPHAARETYERDMRTQGFSDFQIVERSPEGKMIRAADREEYVVVHYLLPFEGNEAAFGYDIASDSARLTTLLHAKQTGEISSTERIRLVQEPGTEYGILICAPVYTKQRANAGSTSKQELLGYVVGALRVSDVVDAALHHRCPQMMGLRIMDASAPPEERELYANALTTDESESRETETGEDPDYLSVRHFDVGGRTWTAYATSSPLARGGRSSVVAIALLITGILLTTLMEAYILKLMHLNNQLATEVRERKNAQHELQEAHAKLEDRVTERTRALEKTTEELRELAMKLSLTEERERRRIAIELHDEIGQMLSLTQMKLIDLCSGEASPNRALELERCLELTRLTDKRVRSMEADLCPPILYDFGLEEAARWLMDRTQKEHGFESSFNDDGSQKPLSEASRLILYRSLREIIFNVVKHAEASSVELSISRDNGHVVLVVTDNGVGFEEATAPSVQKDNRGFGLTSIREQMNRIKGGVEVTSSTGCGTSVTLTAPIDDQC